MNRIRVASGEPLVTGMATATGCISGAGGRVADPRPDDRHTAGAAVAECGQAGTTVTRNGIAKQMGV
ncbi:hypothetical protein Psuf_029990 [Phytohabitans suffuscus]|uniref:Uncharacterized protein n=1 Tax=Phytohabitans suffuscus TaxID=624315 RepID=A0A6F8YHX4_9ACTN|nr:hypothetical protein Psuf_029990 [Phytohabitans suffuscus]